MSGVIEFWFDFGSPYAYFAATQIDAVAGRCQRSVIWRPFLLGAVFKVTEMKPLIDQPLRGPYARYDWNRIARKLGVPFQHLERPPAGLVPSRAFYWIHEMAPELASPFARAVFDGFFGEGRDLGSQQETVELAATLGIDSDQLSGALATDRVKETLRSVTNDAIARGVFGSPMFIVDGEAFWGFDRLGMMEEWIREGGW